MNYYVKFKNTSIIVKAKSLVLIFLSGRFGQH